MLTWYILLLGVAVCYGNMLAATDRLFLLKDENRDEHISHDELIHYLQNCDVRRDLRITEAEFFMCSKDRNHAIAPYAVSLFNAFDVEQKRWIDLNNIVINAILSAFDTDGDRLISKDEFQTYLHERLQHHPLHPARR